jgi:multidrug efflux pump subunit AcrA (membrane-fusion protein)
MIPDKAAFQKSGRTLAYVLRGSKFEERVIEVLRRGNGKIVVSKGLQAGERVALVDPTIPEGQTQQ